MWADLIISICAGTRLLLLWVAIIDPKTSWPRRSSVPYMVTLFVSGSAFFYLDMFFTGTVSILGAVSWGIIALKRPKGMPYWIEP